MAQKRQKSTAGKITPGLAPGDGLANEDAVDPSNNTWVVAVGPGGGPISTSSSGTSSDFGVANQTNYFVMLLDELRDLRKILALMAIDQGVSLPEELGDVFRDDVAA